MSTTTASYAFAFFLRKSGSKMRRLRLLTLRFNSYHPGRQWLLATAFTHTQCSTIRIGCHLYFHHLSNCRQDPQARHVHLYFMRRLHRRPVHHRLREAIRCAILRSLLDGEHDANDGIQAAANVSQNRLPDVNLTSQPSWRTRRTTSQDIPDDQSPVPWSSALEVGIVAPLA